MGLCVPRIEIQYEVLAVRPWTIGFRIPRPIRSKSFGPSGTKMKTIGVIDRVSRFMSKNAHALAFAGAFGLQHLRSLEFDQPGMSQIKRNCKTGSAIRCEPFLGQPDMGVKAKPSFVQISVKFPNTLLN